MDQPKVFYLGTAQSMRQHNCVVLEDGRRPILVFNLDTIRGFRNVEVLYCYSWHSKPFSQRAGVINYLKNIIGIIKWTDLCQER